MNVDVSLGIIGSAGRRDDGPRMNQELYDAMLEKAKAVIDVLRTEHHMTVVRLVSGGAAWADHVAVSLFLNGYAPALDLCLPCPFDFKQVRFVEHYGGPRVDVGCTINFYHRKFSEKLEFDSRHRLMTAMQKDGCSVTKADGFKARNTLVAERSDTILAMTFGQGTLVKPGGTADTVKKFLARPNTGPAFHMDLAQKLCYRNARVA
jgi:hypothetical protein